MAKQRFYKTSYHGGVGSNVSFWGIKGNGYVTNIDLAEEYTLEQVKAVIANNRLRSYNEHPISADHVDDLAIWKVDCQHVNTIDNKNADPNEEYLILIKGKYDGNDLFFLSANTSRTSSCNYEEAKVFNREEAQVAMTDNELWYSVIPKFEADEAARRTFQTKNINRRIMVSGAGATGIRKPRARKTTGKVMMNCPSCGKINWQYDPHEFEDCSHCDYTERNHW
ncbi:conserved hypothetical protein [Vibrio chagasii]|nr:conserved hypothetical protein [Vibrio chagasii]